MIVIEQIEGKSYGVSHQYNVGVLWLEEVEKGVVQGRNMD